MLVRLKNVSSRTLTIITTFTTDTVMGTVSIVINTFVRICDNKHNMLIIQTNYKYVW